jgi:hypothetical protein
MNPSHFPPLATILFLGVTVFVFGAVVQGLVVGLRGIRHPHYTSVLYTVIFAMLAWLAGLLLLSSNGFFADFESMPPKVLLALAVPLVTMLVLAFHRSFGDLLDSIPMKALIYCQAFRVVVELVLWLNYQAGVCPRQMTFEGWNYDIVAGVTAPLAAYIAFGGGRRNKILAIAWNLAGMALLANILVIAILSAPQLGILTPPNHMVSYWPMIWLPGFLAPFAMMLHLFSLRQLMRMK